MIKFVSDLRQVSGFPRVSSTNKTDRHDIAEILLKVALNTITLTLTIFFLNQRMLCFNLQMFVPCEESVVDNQNC